MVNRRVLVSIFFWLSGSVGAKVGVRSGNELDVEKTSCNNPWAIQTLPFCFPDNYQQHMIPQLPTDVDIYIRVRDVTHIEDDDLTAELQCYLDLYWVEPRMRFTNNETIWDKTEVINLDPALLDFFWLPDLDVWNMREFHMNKVLKSLGSFEIFPDKTVCVSFSVRIVLECPFSFKSYPLDKQKCFFQMGSYVYNSNEMMFTSTLHHYSDVQRKLQYSLTFRPLTQDELFTYEYNLQGQVEANFSVCGGVLELQRIFLPFGLRLYLPSGIIVMASWISFSIQPQVVAGRMALLITLLLVLINLSIGASAMIPRGSPFTALELWIIVCIIFVGGALVQYAFILKKIRYREDKTFKACRPNVMNAANKVWAGSVDERQTISSSMMKAKAATNNNERHPEDQGHPRFPSNLDAFSQLAFPVLFALFNLGYWITFINSSRLSD